MDSVAKSALDLPITQYKTPYSDFKGTVHLHIRNRWQAKWDLAITNKLHAIKPTLGEWAPAFRKQRREEIVLARLRIGHTYLTHSYLLRGEPPPECTSCQTQLTVSHILIDCVEFNHIRPNYFNCNNITQLFNSADPRDILDFVRAIGIFSSI